MVGCGGIAEARRRGGEVNLPSSEGVREYEALSRTLRSRRKRRVRRIELASRNRRTLVGVRRWRHGAAGKFSPGFRRFSAEFRRFSPPNGALNDENPVWQTKFREFARRSVAKSEPRAPKSGPQAAKERPRARQGGQVGGQEGPRGASGGFPRRLERPRRPFWRSEDRRNRLSRATCGVTRSKSAFEAVF